MTATPPVKPPVAVPPKAVATVPVHTKAMPTAVAARQVDPTKKSMVAPSAALQQRAFTITALDDETAENWLNMLVYAAHGVGKTTLMASACDVPDMCDVLMLDFESGKMTLKNNPRVHNTAGIDRIRITSFRQLGKVHEFLKKHVRLRDDPSKEAELIALEAQFKGVPKESITTPRRYMTVMLDSLSELDTLCLYELLGISSDANLETVMNEGDPETAKFDEYKKNNMMLQLVVRAYRDLPINVLLVCHAAFTQDELKRMLWSPALTGKLAKQVQGFVDVVGYLVAMGAPAAAAGADAKIAADTPRRIYLQPMANKFDAKCRIASFKQAYIDNPYMTDIWAAHLNQ